MGDQEAEFCIVGGGYAGLTAALRLIQAGRLVALLEARDRVGGRVHTEHMPNGAWLDFGGTWLGDYNEHIRALAKEMEVGTYPTYDRGESICVTEDGAVHRYAGTVPMFDLIALANLGGAIMEFESMAAELPMGSPWDAPKAQEWDSQTMATWLSSFVNTPSRTAREMLKTLVNTLFCADPIEISLLQFVTLIRSHGSLNRLTAVKGGIQQHRFVGGAQEVANRMAARIGSALHLSSPVRAIAQDAAGVTVTADGTRVRARRAIVTVPPVLSTFIQFDPLMPPDRTLLMQRTLPSSARKIVAVYDEAFWRESGLTGVSLALASPVGATIDICTESGRPGMLCVFMVGSQGLAAMRMTDAARRQLVLDALVQRFGPKAATPIAYYEHEWVEEEWTRGGIFGHCPPGVLSVYGSALREPFGRIHWAGTETAIDNLGSIDGAVSSGERAVEEVLQAD
jgi:monoamine oxidase